MATSLASQPITIREYLNFKAPAGFRDELVNGRIIVSPEPKVVHFQIADNLYGLLKKAAGKKYRAAQRVNLRFPASNSMPSPDLFVIAREEYNRAMQTGTYPEGNRVVLAVEVLSPSNRKRAVQSKVELYREHGIEAWVLDPKQQELQLFRDDQILSLNLKIHKSLKLPPLLGSKTILLARIFDLC
jgi:Uma2 family endonuclease